MTNEYVLSAWTDLLEALEHGDIESVVDAATTTLLRYDESYVEERLTIERLHHRRRETGVYDESMENEFLDRQLELQIARLGGLSLLELLQVSPEGLEFEEIRSTFEEIKKAESELFSLSKPVQKRLITADLPPAIAILRFDAPAQFIPAGESIELPATVANIGTSTGEPIDLMFSLSDSDEAIAEVQVGGLSGGAVSTYYASIDPLSPGLVPIRCVSLVDGRPTDSATSRIEVISKTGMLELLYDQLSDLDSLLSSRRTRSYGQRRSLRQPLTTATKHTSYAIEYAKEDLNQKADNRIRTATNALDSLLNRLEMSDAGERQNRNGRGSTDELEMTLRMQTISIINDFETAQRATT